MRLPEVIKYPFSRAQEHFEAASQSTVWNGRVVVHYIVGGLEMVPVFNYLFVLVDLVFRSLLGGLQGQKPPVAPYMLSAGITAEDFCKEHQITLKSPLVDAIEKIQNLQKGWIEPAEQTFKWDMRVGALGGSIDLLLKVLEPKKGIDSWKDNYEELQKIKGDIKKHSVGIHGLHQRFQDVLKEFFAFETSLTETWLAQLNKAFQHGQFPLIRSVDDYLQSLGFANPSEFSKYFNNSKSILRKMGIETLMDIDCLGLRLFDEDKVTLRLFEAAFKCDSEHSEIQNAYQTYLEELNKKLVKDLGSDELADQLVGSNETNEFLKSVDQLRSLISQPLSQENKLKQAQDIVQQFGAYDRLRQRVLLKKYLNQNAGLNVWQSTKVTDSNLTLSGYCALHDITTPSRLYTLGAAFSG